MFKVDNKTALLVVDMQYDFMPGGALPVEEGDLIIPYVNNLIEDFIKAKGVVVLTKDWHPSNHCSFKEQGGPWPAHCVAQTQGARVHEDLIGGYIFYKGNKQDEDSYSGFGGSDGDLSLDEFLKELDVKKVIVVGLAADFCVKATALDARKLGYETLVDMEGTRFVFPEKRQEVIKELVENFVMVLE